MEACGGSHFLGRALREQGHDVRLMPAQYVKPYVKTNKNDYIDAEAYCRSGYPSEMRFVPIKTDDQLDLQSLHRVRERWVVRRTAVINQIRGIAAGARHHDPQGTSSYRRVSARDPGRSRQQAVRRIACTSDPTAAGDAVPARADRGIRQADRAHLPANLKQCKRLVAIPGIGPMTATATVAAIGNGAAFKKGRGFAAWLGVVPGEHSTGGKQKLTGTSRRGNKYLRKLFVQGAHAVLLQRTKQSPGLSTWLARSHITQAHSSGDSGASQQDGAHGLGGFVQRRSLSPAASHHKLSQPDGLHMTPGTKRQAWKSLTRFPHLQSNDDG